MDKQEPKGLLISFVKVFLTGPLSIIMVILAIIFGIMAVVFTPREEDPQIVVPMIDVKVNYPGHSPKELEQLVTRPLERLLWQIDGVEHVYSISRRDASLVTVRFYVGEDLERSLVKVNTKMNENFDKLPPGPISWNVESVEIDDVPITNLTFYSETYTPYELRRLVEEVKSRMDALRDISLTEIYGGYKREILIEPDIENMAARHITLADISSSLKRNNYFGNAGNIQQQEKNLRILVKPGINTIDAVKETVITTSNGGLVRLNEVATIKDGPRELENYVNIGFGPAANSDSPKKILPAVTLAFSKKKGTNAVTVAESIINEAEKLKGKVIPEDVNFIVTRNYGVTADNKVNDLITGMFFAIITVVGLISITMGWREGIIVGLAVPVSFALALFVNYIAGYSINRVTLFALILSLGLVVDDPITNVDNIQRHIRMGLLDPFKATLAAVHEVLPPVIMSTLAIIVSFTPMFFITGMMGPYMRPMAINVPMTVTFSTLCALTFVPWLSYNLLKNRKLADNSVQNNNTTPLWISKFYAMSVKPFLEKKKALFLLGTVLIMTFLSALLMLFLVPLKMLPFDNKDELQVILEMPTGSNLEKTSKAVSEIENYLTKVNEVDNFESYIGINSPIDFNGLVRHYNARRNQDQADIRINLAPKTQRKQQSHTIALRIHRDLTAIADKYDAVLSLVEMPPGPPVLSTLTIEVYGQPDHDYKDLIAGADLLKEKLRMIDSKHIVQIDDYSDDTHPRITFVVNKDKAALHNLTVSEITDSLQTALKGNISGIVHLDSERTPLQIRIRLPLDSRSDLKRLEQLWIGHPNKSGPLVQLSQLGHFETEIEEQPIYHKNLKRVVFVTAECLGRPPGEIILQTLFSYWENPVYSLFKSAFSESWINKLPNGTIADWGGEGEWQITVRVFRDLGIAFGLAMIGILLLLIIQTRSLIMPIIIMCAIPLTIIGIAPGFFLLNLITGRTIMGYADPVFFTATGMIGMIALGGIVIRNSIVLIEFIQEEEAKGTSLKEAILQSGAVRFRPIVLTALTTMMGAWPITLDPIFSGLAWALIFGLLASTFFTLLVIPAVYMMVFKNKQKKQIT